MSDESSASAEPGAMPPTDPAAGPTADAASDAPTPEVLEARHLLGTAAEVREQIAGVRATAESSDGAVKLLVDAAGRLLDLQLQAPAKSDGSRALSREILRLADEAASLAGRRALEISERGFGVDSAMAAALRERAAEAAARRPAMPPTDAEGDEVAAAPEGAETVAEATAEPATGEAEAPAGSAPAPDGIVWHEEDERPTSTGAGGR